MSSYIKDEVLLVGTGEMAIEYSRVLQALGIKHTVIGRSEKGVSKFKEKTNTHAYSCGLENNIHILKERKFKQAIVAVSLEKLAEVTLTLIKFEIKNILVEKPAGLNYSEVEKIAIESKKRNIQVFVAYNRRFYSSVIATKKIIENDGGVTSFNFEFTEWAHKIEKMEKPTLVLEQWFFVNSTHVIDLAFYLGGFPKEIKCFTRGETSWHPKGSIYAGAGISECEALFSYQANWGAPGRWGVEILTKNHRLILRPLEELYIQKLGEVTITKLETSYKDDTLFKPGLFKQVDSFLKSEPTSLLDIDAHLLMCKKVYEKMNRD